MVQHVAGVGQQHLRHVRHHRQALLELGLAVAATPPAFGGCLVALHPKGGRADAAPDRHRLGSTVRHRVDAFVGRIGAQVPQAVVALG